jgi:hypothetical protein
MAQTCTRAEVMGLHFRSSRMVVLYNQLSQPGLGPTSNLFMGCKNALLQWGGPDSGRSLNYLHPKHHKGGFLAPRRLLTVPLCLS